jgi:hypothetical protein
MTKRRPVQRDTRPLVDPALLAEFQDLTAEWRAVAGEIAAGEQSGKDERASQERLRVIDERLSLLRESFPPGSVDTDSIDRFWKRVQEHET